jgi:hypothetical protein
MIERRRLALQCFQVVLRIETLLVPAIRPRMPGDHLAVPGHHLDVVHVALDRHSLKGRRPRGTVAVVVEAHRLILVHLGRLGDAWVEAKGGQ